MIPSPHPLPIRTRARSAALMACLLGLNLTALPMPPTEEKPDLMAMARELMERSARKAPAVDPELAAFAALKLKVPLDCREYHIWNGAPWGAEMPDNPQGQHWRGLTLYGQFNPTTTLDEFVPGLPWRRWIQTTGYPFLGPYDAGQREIIRWQLRTAKAAGLRTLYVHLWPSLWDDGADFTPLPVFERILEEAAALDFPVAVHDEIAFRRPPNTRAQTIDSCIRRAAGLVSRYGRHPGWFKRKGMPVYYFQNHNKWLSAEGLEAWTAGVEAKVGPVWWMLEMGPDEAWWSNPRVKSVQGANNSWFLHTEPFGAGPHPWERLEEQLQKGRDMARRLGKEFSILVYTRFNDRNDRGKPGKGRIDAEEGAFFRKGLAQAARMEPDFIVATQWNDFEESGFIEPAWDFDGWEGDPYRWCRFTAASVGKVFQPAPLPARGAVDPAIRHRLFGDHLPADLGPVVHAPLVHERVIDLLPNDTGAPLVSLDFIQSNLASWSKDQGALGSLRLANSGMDRPGTVVSNQELRFYLAKGSERATPTSVSLRTLHLAVLATVPDGTALKFLHRAWPEIVRIDSTWNPRMAVSTKVARIPLDDGRRLFWVRLEHAAMAGSEGDLTLSLTGKREECRVESVWLCDPDRIDTRLAVAGTATRVNLPDGIRTDTLFVMAPRDRYLNAGPPRPFFMGKGLPLPGW